MRVRTVVGALALITVAQAAILSGVAVAVPEDELRAQARALEAKIAEHGAQVAALGEQLNAAQLALDEAQAKVDDAQARISAAEAEATRIEHLVRDRAASLYRSRGNNGLPVLDIDDATDAIARVKYGQLATARDTELLDDLDAARDDLSEQRRIGQTQRAAAQSQRDALAVAKTQADAAAAAQQGLLAEVNDQLAPYVREEQARREAAAASARTGRRDWSGPVPNPSGGAAAAVAFARAQLGKPYEYAASGPDTYDCSGLTMRAWQAGGLSLPHYSGAQGSRFPRVPLDQLQPGDLITTSSWSAHVGIWVGGGYVHATHTGDVIKFVSGNASVRDAVRPG